MVLEQFIIDADIIWDQVGKTFFENPEAKPGRIMRVQVVNAGIIENLTGYTLNLGWTSVRDPSKFGLDAFDDVDITKGIFEIEYTSGMLKNIGPLNASLQLVPPVEGRPIESNNFKLTVKNSAINPEAIQGETSFSTLENALVEVNGWNANIGGKVSNWEADMAVTKQLYIDKMEKVESTYPQELVSLQGQLAETDARLSTIVANAGDGTIPSELADMRVGANSELNNAAGDTIRKLAAPMVIEFGNMVNLLTMTSGYSIDTLGSANITAGSYASAFEPVIPGKKIYFSMNGVAQTLSRIAFYDANKVFISYSDWIYNVTVPANARYMRYNLDQWNYDGKPQLEYGTGITAWKTYNPHTYYLDGTKIRNAPYETIANVAALYGVTFYNFQTVLAVVGHEMNIYFDTIAACSGKDSVFFKVTCPTLTYTNLKHYQECIRINPTSNVIGAHVITLRAYRINTTTLVATTTINVNILADTALTVPKKLLFLGDSLTDYLHYHYHAKDLLGANATLYGTRGTAPYNHEGRSSWAIWEYNSRASKDGVTNPFFNPATSLFDFSYYIANNPTYSDLDVLTIFLGRNDGYTNGFENGLDTIVASVRAYSATIKIVLLTPYPTGITNDGAGRVLQNTWDERRDMFIGLNAFYNKFKNREASNIYIVPVHLNLDTLYDYPHTLEQVSARNTETIMRITDNVHPNNFGGMKFADVWYNWFVWYLQQV